MATIITLASSVENPKKKSVDIYQWLLQVFKCVLQEKVKPNENNKLDALISSIKDDIKDCNKLTVVFDKAKNKKEEVLQSLYVQKMQIKEKILLLFCEEILTTWKMLKNIIEKIQSITKDIEEKARATQSYFDSYIQNHIKPLVEGRKVLLDETNRDLFLDSDEYKNQKQRSDAAIQVIRSMQQNHRDFWKQGSVNNLDKLREIRQQEEEAIKKAQEEVGKMVVIRQKMLDNVTTPSVASFSVHTGAEEAHQYMRDFERIVIEECAGYRYQIIEFRKELNDILKKEFTRLEKVKNDVKKEEERLIEQCDKDIALLHDETGDKTILLQTVAKMSEQYECISKQKVFVRIAKEFSS